VRQTATAGYVVGGVGVALAAVTVYLFVHHGGGEAAVSGPYVAPMPGGATAGYAVPF
jgi:hypothetical protein